MRSFLLFSFIFLFCRVLVAVPSGISLSGIDAERTLAKGDFYLFEDKSSTLSFAQVSASSYRDSFQISQNDYEYNEHESSAYWIMFVVDPSNALGRKFVLEDFSQQTQVVEAYIPDDSGTYRRISTGASLSFIQRYYQSRNFVFDLPVLGSAYIVYLRVKSDNHAGFHFVVRTQQFFSEYSITEYLLAGIYYGILLIIAVYNLLMFITVRERVYLYYVFYVASCILLSASEDGLGFQYLWPFHPSWNIPIDYYAAPILFLLFFVGYSVSFLQLQEVFGKLFRLLMLVVGAYLLYFLLQVSLGDLVPYVPGLYAVPFVVLYLITFYVAVRGHRPARYFAVGYTFILLSVIVNQLRIMQAVPDNLLTIYSFNIGILLEVLTLSFALGDRFRMLKQEKDIAQSIVIRELQEKERYKNALIAQLKQNETLKDRVNEELEEKVKERTLDLASKTEELAESNQKLHLALEQLRKMNADLDIDNWGLKKRVSEETKLRITAEEVSYEEFQKIYPDDTACFRHLEELKWGSGFHCRKCGHDKHSETKHFVRKCTRCGHIESVTAATLFHSIKFPLHKAFYIVYVTTTKKEKLTLEGLSELLDLRKNTCWAFRKKVVERREKLEIGKKVALKWENLFLD